MRQFGKEKWHQDSNWRKLMNDSQNGNKSSYKTLLDEFYDWLILYFDGNEHLTLETLINVHDKLATCPQAQAVDTWLASLAEHKSRKAFSPIRPKLRLIPVAAFNSY